MNTLQHLRKLVSFDTQNPPRKISIDNDIFQYISSNLTGFDISTKDNGDGCISLLAVRGSPNLLFNFHIDTVPVANNWSSNPFELVIESGRATGLGACDIKGASACMLSAASQTNGDVALLFTSDEEHGSSIAVREFLKCNKQFTQVIVAEPTCAMAVLAHRGIQSASATFSGVSGHASEARAIKDSAIHKAGEWISSSLNWIKQQKHAFENLKGLPFNIGKIEGGIKANMIADSCHINFGFRPLPGQKSQTILQELTLLSNNESDLVLCAGFTGTTLPAENQNLDLALGSAKSLSDHYAIPIGPSVNYWTEASLFSEAGMTALVYGPGDIAQAHTANEWVDIEQLEIVTETYIKIIETKNEF